MLRLLDLYCGAGGASVGYARAGFDVEGVDLVRQPRYPFVLHRAGAISFLRAHGQEYDVIAASPPCQSHSLLAGRHQDRYYGDAIVELRKLLIALRLPYVIENVPGAPLRNPVILCGNSFGLRVYRHRAFESNLPLYAPPHVEHTVSTGSGHAQRQRKAHFAAGGFVTVTGNIGTYAGPEGMGIDWMTGAELSQAIPPAYTEFLGKQIVKLLRP